VPCSRQPGRWGPGPRRNERDEPELRTRLPWKIGLPGAWETANPESLHRSAQRNAVPRAKDIDPFAECQSKRPCGSSSDVLGRNSNPTVGIKGTIDLSTIIAQHR
jgi:hypothetical protein